MRLSRSACAAVLMGAMYTTAFAQAPGADDLLARGSAFAERFFDGLSQVVAEELYEQETTSPRAGRVLRSDFYMVRYPGAHGWVAFRDVFEVDGRPVRPRDERLMHLFADPPRDVLARAAEIAREGARYNIRDIGTVNNPLFALALLQPKYSGRFRFSIARPGSGEPSGLRILRFEEWMMPTLLRGMSNSNLPVSGLVTMDDATGRVTRTELEVGQARFPARIVTDFAFDETLGIHVPREMRDQYPDGAGEIRGLATYGRFRRFEVRTREEIGGVSR